MEGFFLHIYIYININLLGCLPVFPSPHGPDNCSKPAFQPVRLWTCLDLFSTQALYSICSVSTQKHHLSLSHKPDSSNTFYKLAIPGEETRTPAPARSTTDKVPKESIPLPDANCATSSPYPSCPLTSPLLPISGCLIRAGSLGSRDMNAF